MTRLKTKRKQWIPTTLNVTRLSILSHNIMFWMDRLVDRKKKIKRWTTGIIGSGLGSCSQGHCQDTEGRDYPPLVMRLHLDTASSFELANTVRMSLNGQVQQKVPMLVGGSTTCTVSTG